MDVDTEALRWFQQVADGVTVTEVADLFMVSQPGVSRALARLETEVGTPLLYRSGRLLRPTQAGTVLKRHVDAVLHALDDGSAAVAELLDPRSGTVRLAFQQSFGTWLVPDLIASFRREHPGITFELEASHDAHGSSLVTGGRTDLELTARRPHHPDVHWAPLFSQPLRLALPPGHRLTGSGQVSLADVAEEDFVMLRPAWELRLLCEELCLAAGFTPQVAFEGDDLSVVRGFVAAGLGVAVVPATGQESADPRLVPLTSPGASREVGLTWSHTRRLLPSAELFRNHALEALRDWSQDQGPGSGSGPVVRND